MTGHRRPFRQFVGSHAAHAEHLARDIDVQRPQGIMIIGTGNDPQFAAALDYLQKAVRREAGAQHG